MRQRVRNVTPVTQNVSRQGTTAPLQPVAPAPVRPPGASTRVRRSPRLLLIGLLVSVLGALGVTAAFTQATTSSTVVAMARSVPRGQTVTQADLTTVTIGAVPGISTVPGSRLDALVGQTALVDLPSGSLVGEHSIGEAPVQPDTAQLGLKLEAGRLPNTGLVPGTRVLLVEVSGPATGGKAEQTTGATRTFPAVVVRAPAALPDGASWVLDVSVADTDGAVVAGLAAGGRLSVVRTP